MPLETLLIMQIGFYLDERKTTNCQMIQAELQIQLSQRYL